MHTLYTLTCLSLQHTQRNDTQENTFSWHANKCLCTRLYHLSGPGTQDSDNCRFTPLRVASRLGIYSNAYSFFFLTWLYLLFV